MSNTKPTAKGETAKCHCIKLSQNAKGETANYHCTVLVNYWGNLVSVTAPSAGVKHQPLKTML